MMGSHVLTKNDSLIESTGTNGAAIGLLSSVNALVFAQCSTVGECLPTEATRIRTFASVNANVNLLRASAAECFATLTTWKRSSAEFLIMRMSMAHQRSAVGEFLAALVARHIFIAMRQHVSSQSGLAVKAFTALGAIAIFVRIMNPSVLQETPLVLARLPAEIAGIWWRIVGVILPNVFGDIGIVATTFAAQETATIVRACMKFGVRQQRQRLLEPFATNSAHVLLTRSLIQVHFLFHVSFPMALKKIQSMKRNAAGVAEEFPKTIIASVIARFIAINLIVGNFNGAAVFIFHMLAQCIQVPVHFAAI